jgi:hypothetical protein
VSEIGPSTRALIDRLGQMDPAQPRLDRAAVERALRAHLRMLGLRGRRIVWLADARSGLQHVTGRMQADGGRSAVSLFDRGWAFARLLFLACLGGLGSFAVSAPLGLFVSWAIGDKTGRVLRDHLGPPTLTTGALAAAAIVTLYLSFIWVAARNIRRRSAVARAIEAALSPHLRRWDVATRAIVGDEVERRPDAAHEAALGEVVGPSLRHFTGSQACPMAEAFAAGLFLYWVTRREVVCVPQPALHIAAGRLYRVSWPTGECYSFRRGIKLVPLEASA